MEEELVRVEFRVPVSVHVDADEGEVVSVQVHDLSLIGPLDVCAYSGAEVEPAIREAAVDLTSDDTRWPQWVIGFDHA